MTKVTDLELLFPVLNQSSVKRSCTDRQNVILAANMVRISWFFLLIIVATASGCAQFSMSTVEAERKQLEAQNTPPQNYKPDLLAFMRTYLNNPDNVREAAISEPRKLWIVDTERYATCLRYNAKDSSGRYTGLRDRLAVFISGKLDRLIELAPAERDASESASARYKPLRDYCAGAGYQPFPELERLHR